jgi:hypothetical protein
MSVYEASRLAGGNALFPATITLGKDEVTFKVPGLFDGKEKSLPYRQITSIEINGGALSLCEIVIRTTRSGRIVAPGFSHIKAKEIQAALKRKIDAAEKNPKKSTTAKSSSSSTFNRAEIDYVIASTDKTLNDVYDSELTDLRRFYELQNLASSGKLNEEDQSEYEVLKISTNDGTPSALLRDVIEEKGIDFVALFASNKSIGAFTSTSNKSKNSKDEISNEQILTFLKKYWKYLLIGLVCFFCLIAFLKSREKNTTESAQELHLNLESQAIAVEKLLIEKKYDEALEVAKTLNHPNHIVYDAKSELLNTVYYDTYWTAYKDSLVKEILNQIENQK